MIAFRLFVYVLYIVLGAIILIRVSAFGLRFESLTGFILGGLLMLLGIYRLVLFARMRAAGGR